MAGLPNFRIAVFQVGTGTTIKVVGELDNAAGAELLERFDQVAPAASGVVLDLSEVSFIDSAGMRTIIVIEHRVADGSMSLTIAPPAPEVTELLQVTGIADHIALAPRVDEAPPGSPFIERIELDLPRNPSAPGLGRAEVRALLPGRISDSDRATLTLLTSELVTNAVIHPEPGVEGAVGLRITAYPDRVRVEVVDAGSGFNLQDLAPRPREAGGHGLIVVDGVSSRWGTGRGGEKSGGFSVWFELDVDYAPEAPSAAGEPEPADRSLARAEG
ncbi:MAG: STAS domain-containing protein [Solirubrobacteraceae bacterium]